MLLKFSRVLFPSRFAHALLALALPCSAPAAVEIIPQEGKVQVRVGGELFTEYCYTGAPHVYFYPVLGPGGTPLTRDFPMRDTPGEEHDHPHHRSLWFAHGEVNGIDFWTEKASSGRKPPKADLGQIVHAGLSELHGGEKEGVLRAFTRWVAPDGTVPLTGVQTLRVYDRSSTERLFDFEVTLTAGAGPAVLGDNKEGAMGMRLRESMRLTRADKQPGEGHVLNSEGLRDAAAWGQRARWVDYSGPVEGKVVGVAIFEHPANGPRPTRWHARDYGFLAANPFCGHAMDPAEPEGAAARTIPAGGSLTLRYRFYLHEGDAEHARVAARYAEYLQEVP